MNAKDEHRPDGHGPCGVTRRGFIATAGAGTIGVLSAHRLLAAADAEVTADVMPSDQLTRVMLRVNGSRHTLLVEPRWTLLFVLREKIGLTGTKEGCSRGECGACTVLVDSVPRYACLTLAVEVQDRAVTTVEGLLDGERLGPVQQAFAEHDAFQCGYCTPGQIMAVEGLLQKNGHPSPDDIRTAVSGNLCRCGAYVNIFKAADRAAQLKGGK
jgi:xanthine dehydrogenase YagT iron-sulfur-binding subunit